MKKVRRVLAIAFLMGALTSAFAGAASAAEAHPKYFWEDSVVQTD